MTSSFAGITGWRRPRAVVTVLLSCLALSATMSACSSDGDTDGSALPTVTDYADVPVTEVTASDVKILAFAERPQTVPDLRITGQVTQTDQGCLVLDAAGEMLGVVWPHGSQPETSDGRSGVRLADGTFIGVGDDVTDAGGPFLPEDLAEVEDSDCREARVVMLEGGDHLTIGGEQT